MTATIIDGKSEARKQLESLAIQTNLLSRPPGLAVIIVGDDPASKLYVQSKAKKAKEVGFHSVVVEMSSGTSQTQLLAEIEYLNKAPDIDGILVQLPLPRHIDPTVVIEAIDPKKDVDGFHPYNVGRLAQRNPSIVPCTPLGCMHLIHTVREDIRGMNACVVGASNIVGRPMAQLLLLRGATVNVVHRFTQDSAAWARQCDIVVVAVGKPGLVDRHWIKPGAVVIDVGINRQDGKVVGDVVFDEVVEQLGPHGAITPVPGGVGPMTIACLLHNTWMAAKRNTDARAYA